VRAEERTHLLSPLMINRIMALWCLEAEEFRQGVVARPRMGRPVLRAIPGSSHPRLGLGGYIRNVFTKAEFKCLPTIAVGGFQSEEDGKRGGC